MCIRDSINTSETNTTRFIVIGRRMNAAGNRFSLLFTVDHRAGRLARVMPVSYTHLDVYKRQGWLRPVQKAREQHGDHCALFHPCGGKFHLGLCADVDAGAGLHWN